MFREIAKSVGFGLTLQLALASMALAQGAGFSFGASGQDTNAPVEMVADTLSINQADGTALYSGDVVIAQGEMRIAAPQVLVVYSETLGKIDRLEASGGVTLVSGDEAAEAQRANYNVEAGTILMTGDVLLTQSSGALSAERLLVHLEDGRAEMSGRVRTVLQQSGTADGQ